MWTTASRQALVLCSGPVLGVWEDLRVARTWLSIRVDLIGGRGEDLWPRPGRVFAASRSHTFWRLAEAIDDAFARWDRAHLHQFELADGGRVGRRTGTRKPGICSMAGSCVWAGWVRESSSCTSSTSVTAGRICARLAGSASIPRSSWVSFRTGRCRTGVGVLSRTSTGVVGMVMTASQMVLARLPDCATFLRCVRGGASDAGEQFGSWAERHDSRNAVDLSLVHAVGRLGAGEG